MRKLICLGLLSTIVGISATQFESKVNNRVEEDLISNESTREWTTYSNNDVVYEIPVQEYNNGYQWIDLDPSDINFSSGTITSIKESAYEKYRDVNVRIPSQINSTNVVTIDSDVFKRFDNCEVSSDLQDEGRTRIKGLVIPSTVTAINSKAFYCNDIQVLDIANGSNLNTIGEKAFFYNYLTELTLPNSIRTLGSLAFANNDIRKFTTPSYNTFSSDAFRPQSNNKITEVNIIGGTAIPNDLFKGLKMSNLEIAQGIATIGSGAFQNVGLDKVILPASVTTVDHSTFSGNSLKVFGAGSAILNHSSLKLSDINEGIEELIIDEGTTSLTKKIETTIKLKKVTFPSTLTTIGDNIFEGHDLTDIYIPNNVTSIGTKAFYDNPIVNLTIGKAVESLTLDKKAFDNSNENANVIKNLVILEGATTIPDRVFRGAQRQANSCSDDDASIFNHFRIESVTLPSTITHIGKQAFADNSITSVIFPDSLTSMGLYAFNCNKINYLEVGKALNINDFERNRFTQNPVSTVIINEGGVAVKDGLFKNFRISTLSLPSTLTSIGKASFERNRLTTLSLPTNLNTIGENAFIRNRLKTINFNNSLTSIGISAFRANQLEEIELPSSLRSLSPYAFAFNNLKNVKLNEGLTRLETGIFLFNQLETIVIPSTITSIDRLAMSWNRDLHTIYYKGTTAIAFDQLGKKEDPFHKTNIKSNSYELNYIEPIKPTPGPDPVYPADPVYTGVIRWTIDSSNDVIYLLLSIAGSAALVYGLGVMFIKRKKEKKGVTQ